MALSTMILGKDKNSNVTFGLPFPTEDREAYQFLMAADTEVTLAVPDFGKRMLAKFTFSVGTNVWVRVGSVAVTRPTTAIPTAQNSELNPILRLITGGDTLRFICETPAEVNVVFFKDPRSVYTY